MIHQTAIISRVLRSKTQSCKRKHLTILANRSIAINHNMAMQRDIICQINLIANYAICPYAHILSDNSLF